MREVLNGDNYEPAAEAEDGLLKKVAEAPDAAAGDASASLADGGARLYCGRERPNQNSERMS